MDHDVLVSKLHEQPDVEAVSACRHGRPAGWACAVCNAEVLNVTLTAKCVVCGLGVYEGSTYCGFECRQKAFRSVVEDGTVKRICAGLRELAEHNPDDRYGQGKRRALLDGANWVESGEWRKT